jgi:hypothetical protein
VGGSTYGGSLVACVKRNAAQNPSAAYSGWGYSMDVNGVVTCYNGAGIGCDGSGPPSPPQ